MSDRQEGYYYVEKRTPKSKDTYQVSKDIWSQDQAFEYFEKVVDEAPEMPSGENLVELYDGEKLIARRSF